MKDRLKNKFNVAVAEIGFQDKWQRAQLGIVTLSNQQSHLEHSLQQIFQYLDQSDSYEITSYEFTYV